MRISTSFIAAAAVLAACASTPDPVPVIAEPAEIIALAGTWEGEYETREGEGRSGPIHFSLTEGRDTAHGYVIMTFVPPRPQRVVRPPRGIYPVAPRSEQLAIAFVRAKNGMVTGELAPYTDPVCGCRLQTTFTGQQQGNRITGTFTTTHTDTHTVVRGNWSVRRKTN